MVMLWFNYMWWLLFYILNLFIIIFDVYFFFFKQKPAYELLRSLVGSEMCIRDSAILGAGASPGDEVVIPAQTFMPTGTAGWRHWLPGIAQAQRIQTPAREIARFHCGPTAPRCFFDREASVEEMGRAIPQGGEDLTPSLIGASRVFQNRIKQSTQAVPR